jgi:hypothetical protein
MSCRTCNQSGASSAAEDHRHSHPGLPDLCTPEGAAEFSDASRRDQMVQTVDLARQLLERAAASNDPNASLSAARFFLRCQMHLDRFFDPDGEERRENHQIAELKDTVAHFDKQSYEWDLFLQEHPNVDKAWLQFRKDE